MDNNRESKKLKAEMNEIENVFRAFQEEPNYHEKKIKDLRNQLSEVSLNKLELERMVESEKRENDNLRAQLTVFQQSMKSWESESLNVKEDNMKDKIQLECLTKERNSLLENLKKLQIENMEMKLSHDEYSKLDEKQKQMEKSFLSHKTNMNSILENIYAESKKLEAEQKSLQKGVKNSIMVGELMMQLLQHHHMVLNETLAENEQLKRSVQFITGGPMPSPVRQSREQDPDMDLGKTTLYQHQKKYVQQEELRNNLRKSEELIIKLNGRIEQEVEQNKKLKDLLKNILDHQMSDQPAATLDMFSANSNQQILQPTKKVFDDDQSTASGSSSTAPKATAVVEAAATGAASSQNQSNNVVNNDVSVAGTSTPASLIGGVAADVIVVNTGAAADDASSENTAAAGNMEE